MNVNMLVAKMFGNLDDVNKVFWQNETAVARLIGVYIVG